MDKTHTNQVYENEIEENKLTCEDDKRTCEDDKRTCEDDKRTYEDKKRTCEDTMPTYESLDCNLESSDPEKPGKSVSGPDKRFDIKRSTCVIISFIMIVMLVLAVSFVVLYIVKARHTTEQPHVSDRIIYPLPSTTQTWNTPSTSPSLLSTTTNGPKECPSDWLILGNSCYFLSDSKLTWNDAFIHCLKLAAYLVEINNATEDKFLIEKVKRAKVTFWIGLADIYQENKWVWMASDTDLTLDSYSNWITGEPNDNCEQGEGCDGENCATLVSDPTKWNDDKCNQEYKYICEM